MSGSVFVTITDIKHNNHNNSVSILIQTQVVIRTKLGGFSANASISLFRNHCLKCQSKCMEKL
jgi:hypothetical protein